MNEIITNYNLSSINRITHRCCDSNTNSWCTSKIKTFNDHYGHLGGDDCLKQIAAAIKKMIVPGLMAALAPVVVGLYSVDMLGGLLVGVTISGVCMAIFQANAGGAWDNAKKQVKEQGHKVWGDEYDAIHKATVTGDTVGIERNLAEMEVLTGLLLAEVGQGPPCVGLGDGPLLIWLRPGELPEGRRRQVLHDYLGCLDRLGASGAPVAGFVSRPHSAEVVALLYLAQLEPEARQAVRSLAETDYRGLTDRALFGFLETGQRSALFVRGTPTNQDFRARGHTIHFFYLNTGSDLARVEIPEWVARQPSQLDLVHAAVYDQCSFNNGYPYILTRADELAVILGDERRVLEEMLMQAMVRNGLSLPELSRKAQQKKVARWRRSP